MKHRGSPAVVRRRLSRLRQLLENGELLRASLTESERTCGKPNCKCTRGEKHRSLYVGQSKEGKVRTAYVPPSWEDRVRSWVERRREVDRLLEELSDLCWERLRRRED
jgi:hypothetical protein